MYAQTPHLMDMDRPTNLQSFVWPAVMRGFDVVGICSSRYKSGSPGGKTLSYLLPIISLLNFRSTYKDLPKFSISVGIQAFLSAFLDSVHRSITTDF